MIIYIYTRLTYLWYIHIHISRYIYIYYILLYIILYIYIHTINSPIPVLYPFYTHSAMCRVSFIWVCRLPNPYARDVPCVIGLACPNDPNGVLQQAKVIRRLWGNLDIRKFARECSKILRTILNMCVLSPDPFRNCVNFPPFRNCMDFCCRQVVLAPLEMAFSYSRTISSLTWATELQNVADMAGIWCIHTDTHPTHTHIYIHTHRIHVWYIC